MRVLWQPPINPSLKQEGDVIKIDIISNEYHFLLLNDNGEFVTAPCNECLYIK